MKPSRLAKKRLRHYFRAASLLSAVLAFAALTVVFLPGPVADRLISTTVTQRATAWHTRLLHLISNHDAVFRNANVEPVDLQRLSLFVESTSVLRFKMFSADGLVFYSTRTGEAGGQTKKGYFFATVANGLPFFKTSIKPESSFAQHRNNANFGASDRHLLIAEVYIPVMDRNQFIGAFEFYSDISQLRASFVTRVRLAFITFAAIGTVLAGGALFFLTASGHRKIEIEREHANREKELLAEQMRAGREVRLLSELNEWLQSSRSLEELFSMVSAFMARLLPGCAGTIYVYSNSRDVLDGACSWNGGKTHAHIRPESCWSLRRGRTYAFGESEIDFVCEHLHDHDGRPYYCFPILAHGETVGLMTLMAENKDDRDAFEATRKLAQMSAEQISLAIANVRMRDQLHHQSIRDPLTGLYNRRHFTESLRSLLQAGASSKTFPTVISIDVDHFKNFNDTHGHDAGDIVLRSVSEAMERECDGDELPCRIGGEEFTILLPDCDATEAMMRAEKLRCGIESLSVHYSGKTLPKITISLGVAAAPQHGHSPQELMKSADNALYEAKANGRNQTRIAGRGEAEIPAAAVRPAQHARNQAVETKTPSPAPKARPATKNEKTHPSGGDIDQKNAGKAA